MTDNDAGSARTFEMRLTRRNSLSRRASHEDLRDEESEDEDFGGGENDGIQLGLLSGTPRAGKDHAVDGSNREESSTKQLAMSILGEVGCSFTCRRAMFDEVACVPRLCRRS